MFKSVLRTFYRAAGAALTGFAAQPLQAQIVDLVGRVTIENNRLLRDGRPWIPHGFFQIAFAVPPAAFDIKVDGKPQNPVFRTAYKNYSPSEYMEMRRAGADSVRLNVAQDGADPDNKRYFDRRWLENVIEAVWAARSARLNVILSIQNEPQTGSAGSYLPTDATRRVWRELTPIFGHDRGVLFELYNEPGVSESVAPTSAQWRSWATAMNKTLAVVRAQGATNVVVADGLGFAQQLSGAPKLDDPLHEVAYGSHPYPHDQAGQAEASWDKKFGDFALSEPVIVTEWGVGYYCDERTPQSVVRFINYLQQRRVGLEAVAWDWQPFNFASAVQNFPRVVFSSLLKPAVPGACTASTGYHPGTAHGPDTAFGPGRLIVDWYLTGKPPESAE